MEKKLIPNFTQIPNIILDEYISELGHAEIKVLLYICRRTYGFQKGSDKISLTQFEKGITSANGEQLDHGTGLGRKAIISALNTLIEKGLIVKNDEKNINRFSMQLVSLGNHTSVVKIPELVSLRHPQKKEKESIQNKDIELPEWLNKKVWEDWVQYRKEMKKPLTPMSMKKQIKFLEGNMSDHVKILNKSMVQGWVGIFKLDNKVSSNDAVRAVEKMKSDRERQSYQNQLSTDNENMRKVNEMLRGITTEKSI